MKQDLTFTFSEPSLMQGESSAAVAAPVAPAPIIERASDLDESLGSEEFIVVVYDNSHNTYDEVTLILQRATGCSLEEAATETWEVDHLGKSVVHHSSKEECDRVAEIIRTIGIHVEVTPN